MKTIVICEHSRQRWNSFMSVGECVRCGAILVPSKAIQGEWDVVPSIPAHASPVGPGPVNPDILKLFERNCEVTAQEASISLRRIHKR